MTVQTGGLLTEAQRGEISCPRSHSKSVKNPSEFILPTNTLNAIYVPGTRVTAVVKMDKHICSPEADVLMEGNRQ